MQDDTILSLLRASGALLEGHFLLSSGLHSDRYCQCARLLEDPAAGEQAAALLAPALKPLGATVVLAPALGGVLWGHEVARALGTRSVFAERTDGRVFELRRGFALSATDRVLLAEDVVTTGKSVNEMTPLVEAAGARIVGVASVVDRSGGAYVAPHGAPFHHLARLAFQTWKAEECPLCAAGGKPIKPGSRANP